MSSPLILTPEYYERLRDLEEKFWWNAGMREIAGMLLSRARIPSAGIFADVGCGTGHTMTWFIRDHSKWKGIGFDISADGLRFAHEEGLSVSRATALRLPLADSSLDLVISLDTLQHLPLDGGDEIAIREFFRVLRPGGTLLLRTNAQSFPVTHEDPKFSFRKYDTRTLRKKLSDAGFQIRALGRCNALLGLAEIPRELKAKREMKSDYHGILADPEPRVGFADHLKKALLVLEGKAVAAGLSLPLGRTIFALSEKPSR